MSTYAYRATDAKGLEVRGSIEALGLVDAARQLRARGLVAHALEREGAPAGAGPSGVDAFVFFNRCLAGMAKAGVPLPEAVREIAGALGRGSFRDALEGVEAALREGKPLDQAVAAAPGHFPPAYRRMLEAGARSGNLAAVLGAVARNAEGVLHVRGAVINTLSYPAMVLTVGACIFAFLGSIVLPVYEEALRFKGAEPTALMRMARLVGPAVLPFVIVAALAALGGLVALWLRKTSSGEAALARVPVLGRVLENLALARAFGALSILLRAGAGLPESIAIALAASGSRRLAACAERARARAAEGAGIDAVLREAPLVPAALAGYLAAGAAAGRLADAAGEMAELHSEQASLGTETLTMVALPAAVVGLGIIVGAALIAVVTPHVEFVRHLTG